MARHGESMVHRGGFGAAPRSSSSMSRRTAFSMANERLEYVRSSTFLSSHSSISGGRVTEIVSRLRFCFSPFMLSKIKHDSIINSDCYTILSRASQYERSMTGETRGMQTNTKQEMKGLFQEALAQDLDRKTKELLDSAGRLSWTDDMNAGSIDDWIETTSATLIMLREARARRTRRVGA